MRYVQPGTMLAKAVIRGTQNRNNGKVFERQIEMACAVYREQNIADIEKTPEPMQPERQIGNGKFVAHFSKKAQPDFKGMLAGGRSIEFEAKFTDSDRIAQSVVSDDQTRSLNRAHALGALCYVMVSLSFDDYYRVPWAVWIDMKKKFGHKYMSRDDLGPYRIKRYPYLAFLDGIQQGG